MNQKQKNGLWRDKKSLFYAQSIEETALCVKGKMATTSGREAGLRLRGFSVFLDLPWWRSH
jgi:hypothetical protein